MIEKILKLLSLAGLLFLVFLAGIVAAIQKDYFYWKVQEIYLYREAKQIEVELHRDNYKNLFFPAPTAASGVTKYMPEKSLKGYTFYTDATPSGYLLDMDGRVVHAWHFAYEDAFAGKDIELNYMYWRDAKLLPDGSVVALYEYSDHTPFGAGLIKVDKNSKLIWKYAQKTHHALDIAPDGNIYTMIHDIDKDASVETPGLHSPLLHDWIVVLSPKGEEMKRISLPKALQHSDYRDVFKNQQLNGYDLSRGDVTHLNSIRYITPDMAVVFPHAKAGDVLISIRNLGAIAVVDIEQEKVTWLKTGFWEMQHDASILPNGNIMLFDNLGMNNNRSRVIEYNPTSDAIQWSYSGEQQQPLFSKWRGNAQLLSNGNILITDSHQGHLLEVTRAGEVVWDYFTPLRAGKNHELISAIFSGARFTLQDLPFLEEHP